jgi:hypothetical protein
VLRKKSGKVVVDQIISCHKDPMTRSRAGARLVLKNHARHEVPHGLWRLDLVGGARFNWLIDHDGCTFISSLAHALFAYQPTL